MARASITRREFSSALAAGVAVAGVPGIVRAQSAAKVTLRLSSVLPTGPNSAHWLWYDKFAASLKSKVGEQITIAYFPDGQLGKETDIIGQVKLGLVDMMISGSSIWSTVAPEIGLLDLGYLFTDLDSVGRLLDGDAGRQMNRIFDEKAGVEILSWGYSLGWRNVTARVPVTKPADLKGLKIRVIPVPTFVATLRAMGGIPTPLAGGEIYTALQTGVIDGLEHDAPTVLAFKFHEVAKHITLTRHIFGPQSIVIGRRALAKIPRPLQDDFRAAAREATEYQRGKAAEAEAAALTQLKAGGVTVHECDRAAFRELVAPVWHDFTTTHPTTRPILTALTGQA
jgi:TRAP-type transport system periplasmic protein